jgi:hypothetical protein
LRPKLPIKEHHPRSDERMGLTKHPHCEIKRQCAQVFPIGYDYYFFIFDDIVFSPISSSLPYSVHWPSQPESINIF